MGGVGEMKQANRLVFTFMTHCASECLFHTAELFPNMTL